MLKTNINKSSDLLSSSAIELLSWPACSEPIPKESQVIALQTTRFPPEINFERKKSAYDLPEGKLLTGNNYSYCSFNLGLHVDDNAEAVVKNRKYLQQFIQKNLTGKVGIQWLEQVHGNKVIEVTDFIKIPPIADASITREKNIALAIMTADCLPILLCDTNGTEIAAIHGGWRSLAANIIESTLAKMHSDEGDIQAWLGPCIGQTAFEVSEDVKLAFTQQNINFTKAFLSQGKGKYLADLHIVARQQLANLGITKIASLAECTYHRSDKYYSYRRESVTGRMASVICIT